MLRTYIRTTTGWIFFISITTIFSILAAYFSLTHGVDDLFSFFFLIPMFLAIYRFPERGIIFTVFLGWINLSLVYILGSLSAQDLAVHTAWFYVYVSLGVVVTCIVSRSRDRKEEAEKLKAEAFQQIERNMEQFEILNDEIRNPLQGILLDADAINDPGTKERIVQQVQAIQKTLVRVDKGIVESQKVRNFLKKYYDFK